MPANGVTRLPGPGSTRGEPPSSVAAAFGGTASWPMTAIERTPARGSTPRRFFNSTLPSVEI